MVKIYLVYKKYNRVMMFHFELDHLNKVGLDRPECNHTLEEGLCSQVVMLRSIVVMLANIVVMLVKMEVM